MDYWAVDQGSARAIGTAAWTGQPSVFDETEDLELLGESTGDSLVDSVLGPLTKVQVPQGAVVGGDRRDSTENVQR